MQCRENQSQEQIDEGYLTSTDGLIMAIQQQT